MSQWSLTLPMIPASMNARERQSHWVRRRELQQITRAVSVLAREQRIPEAQGKRRVFVTIHKTKRSRVTDDPANRDSRAKSILDAMVATGLLVDDSDEWLDWQHVHEGDKRDQVETVITIEDAA